MGLRVGSIYTEELVDEAASGVVDYRGLGRRNAMTPDSLKATPIAHSRATDAARLGFPRTGARETPHITIAGNHPSRSGSLVQACRNSR